ncbi:hypothetical protein [Priestia megaterium]|uniref:hypothetical protein n=1 Tax=Priestia megaterium TaxID=1404 RepID=UPI00196ACA0E|nr:hypothetical protein [Priestia megaterium]QSF42313.1 hypothetical protein ICR96_30195 [Priestia megaterium]
MKENKFFEEYVIVDNMWRIEIPVHFLKYVNLQLPARMQIFNYKHYFVIKQISGKSVYINENIESNNLVRFIDDLGRIVIPKFIREIHSININEKMGLNLINKSFIFYKFRKGSESLHLTLESTESAARNRWTLELKKEKITLPDFVLQALDLEVNMQLQFFIKNPDTIIVKKHLYNFYAEKDLTFTGQSRVISKNKYLNIPKMLRDYLNIKNGDVIEANVVKDTLVMKKST